MLDRNEFYREACRRQHRTVANYLAMLAWCKGADCIVLDRSVMKRVFDVKNFQLARIDWLRVDMQPWFPEIRDLGNGRTTGSIFLSRINLDRWMNKRMSDSERIELMRRDAVSVVVMDYASSYDCSEAEMVAELSMMANGLKPPAFDEKQKGFMHLKLPIG